MLDCRDVLPFTKDQYAVEAITTALHPSQEARVSTGSTRAQCGSKVMTTSRGHVSSARKKS
jgi:hypothetical protein